MSGRKAKPALPGLPIVHVRWRDAIHHEGWAPPDWIRTQGIAPADTVGVLVHETSDCIAIAMTVGQGRVADVTKIPRGMVDSIVVLGSIDSVRLIE